MKRCPKCMNITESKFCPECGNDMSTVEALICPKCGNETTSRFCPECGTKMLDSSESIGIGNSGETPIKESGDTLIENSDDALIKDKGDALIEDSGTIPVTDNEHEPGPDPGIGNAAPVIAAKKENSDSLKKLRDMITKKPMIAGAVILLLVIVLLAAISPDKKTEDTSAGVNTDSYSTNDESSQGNDSASDSDYSSSDSDYSGSTTDSYSDDGLSLIQGSWKMVGVVTDGESTNVSGLSIGSLVINGDRWTMKISTDETTENSGTLYYETKSYLDSGEPFYVYTMTSDGMTGSVQMAYSSKDDFIAVSTKPTLDSNNCMMFGR